MDRLRVIELDGGRPVELHDLEEEGVCQKQRDTFVVNAPQKQPRMAELGGRFGGQRAVGEKQDNGSITATWRVMGSTAQEVATRVGDLLAQVEDASGSGRYLEWRPDGHDLSSLYELRGPGVWAPKYSWAQFLQNQSLDVDLTWPVAPYALGLPMDILDEFNVDSSADYAFETGAASDVLIGSGLISSMANQATERRLIHTDRGYSVGDHEDYIRGAPGSVLTGYKLGVVLKSIDASNRIECYVDDDGVNSRLRIDKVVAGVRTNLTSTNLGSRVSTGVAFSMKGRIAGDVVVAEYWNSSTPGSMTSPTLSVTSTLAGADATLFGAGVTGSRGLVWAAQHGAATVGVYVSRPYSYDDVTWPTHVDLLDVPGDLPALVDLRVGSGSQEEFALFAFGKKPVYASVGDSTDLPMQLLQGQDAAVSGGWTLGAAAGKLSTGNIPQDITPTSAESYEAYWTIDPSLLGPDEFSDYVVVSLWARVWLDASLVTPRLAAFARGSTTGPKQYTQHGATGKSLVVPGVDAWRFHPLGHLALPANRNEAWQLGVAGILGAGSAGNKWAIDYLLALPARGVSHTPTGKANDSSYPKFLPITNQEKEVTHELRGRLRSSLTNSEVAWVASSGLGGEPLEVPPGDSRVVAKFCAHIPDDPSSVGDADDTTESACLHVGVTPRYHLLRGA